jgi:hydrogenase expression/formation protein HypE
LASALIEIAESASIHIRIEEEVIPARDDVRGACEILGFDPIYVANEGRFVAFVAQDYAQQALKLLRSQPSGEQASIIGSVVPDKGGLVTIKSRIGTTRIVDMLSGEQLPRIC